jgi:hypothetical protein
MKRTLAIIALATATATSFAAPSFAAILSDADIMKVERLTGADASNLTTSQQAFIHGLIASGELSDSNAAQRIRAVIEG